MQPLPQSPRARRWEDAGIIFGAFLAIVNLVALLTTWLSGPLFHPVGILFGVIIVYAFAAMRAGAMSDQADMS